MSRERIRFRIFRFMISIALRLDFVEFLWISPIYSISLKVGENLFNAKLFSLTEYPFRIEFERILWNCGRVALFDAPRATTTLPRAPLSPQDNGVLFLRM